jgi:hypothetical protein
MLRQVLACIDSVQLIHWPRMTEKQLSARDKPDSVQCSGTVRMPPSLHNMIETMLTICHAHIATYQTVVVH